MNFPGSQARNMAGNDTFWFVLDSAVSDIPSPEDDVISDDIVLTPGILWSQGFATLDTLNVEDEPDFNEQGDRFPVRITFRVPKDQPGTLNLLLTLKKGRHIVCTRSQNGYIKVHGKLGLGLKFNYRPLNPAESAGYSGYQCEFYGEYDEPSWFYGGVITVDGGYFSQPYNPGTVYTVGGFWLFGSSAPNNNQGKNGDGFFDYNTQLIYEKVGNVWVLRGYLGPDQELEEYAFCMASLAITGNLM